jgi:hypothetical protein
MVDPGAHWIAPHQPSIIGPQQIGRRILRKVINFEQIGVLWLLILRLWWRSAGPQLAAQRSSAQLAVFFCAERWYSEDLGGKGNGASIRDSSEEGTEV